MGKQKFSTFFMVSPGSNKLDRLGLHEFSFKKNKQNYRKHDFFTKFLERVCCICCLQAAELEH